MLLIKHIVHFYDKKLSNVYPRKRPLTVLFNEISYEVQKQGQFSLIRSERIEQLLAANKTPKYCLACIELKKLNRKQLAIIYWPSQASVKRRPEHQTLLQ